MRNTPINHEIVAQKIKESGLSDFGKASIREIVRLVNCIEQETGEEFIRMEMGVPGLEPSKVGVEAEKKALDSGVASKYAPIEGVPELKEELSRFFKLFCNIDVDPMGCIPTIGAMQAAFACFLVANRNDHHKEGSLFIDPGFPVQKQQCTVIGHSYHTFDVYDFRGKKLRDKLESYLEKGNISSILYSNPNNPAWICFNDEELQIIGEVANKYDVVVIEDLAYFAMDFRHDYSQPGKPPYQPTVAHYADNYILLFSSSKAFSYAGQRIGALIVSDKLFNRKYPDLLRYYTSEGFGYSLIYGALYALSAGVGHSAQYALAAMLKEANEGHYNFVKEVKEYGEKAVIMKKMFVENGFRIVYEKDVHDPIADGFFFTIAYPGMTGPELLEKLLYYGISSICLSITLSKHTEGLRACVSLVKRAQFPELKKRLAIFHLHHS